ncbi:hypothetical protein SMICM17S_04151 [Streptomyces microflavus]
MLGVYARRSAVVAASAALAATSVLLTAPTAQAARSIRLGFRFGWSGVGRRIGRLLTRHGRTEPSPVTWSRAGGPWFGNQLMTLTLRGRNSALTLVQAKSGAGGNQLVSVLERSLTREP